MSNPPEHPEPTKLSFLFLLLIPLLVIAALALFAAMEVAGPELASRGIALVGAI